MNVKYNIYELVSISSERRHPGLANLVSTPQGLKPLYANGKKLPSFDSEDEAAEWLELNQKSFGSYVVQKVYVKSPPEPREL